MDIVLTIIAVIVIFSALVLIHEYGHFVMARRAGIKVEEFGIGFPPRLFKKKFGETLYTINAIPFGGFVKLYGEDSSDPEAQKSKRSFSSKSPWVRTKVVVAGVVMNFILAIVLLTIGFSFGIEPLLVTEDDLFEHLAEGNVVSAPGVFVSKISEKAKTFGLTEGDQILAIDDRPLTQYSQVAIFSKKKAVKDVDVTVASKDGVIKKLHVPLLGKDHTFGVDLKPFTELPRLAVYEIKPGSTSAKAGIQVGDVIVKMNGQNVYYPSDFDAILTESGSVGFSVLRGTQMLQIPVVLPESKKVIVANVFDDSTAQKAGFQPRDVIVNIQGMDITTPQQVVDVLRANGGKELAYRILRGTSTLEIKAAREDKKELGIALSLLASYKNSEISVYRSSVITSFIEIKKVHYAPWTAFKHAITESVRLTGITVEAFANTIGSVISKFAVPGDVGGPVQIAYYTHTFVQEGFFALLRFAALLSLSLAVINVLPIPALDGGRLLFIVVEVIFRRRVNARLEAIVHTIGFVLLLLLIGLVTYSDIVKLF